jgi:hypothetical protein
MRTVLLALIAVPAIASAGELRVTNDRGVTGFAFPESCAYDPGQKMLYVGEFGGEKLAPAEKDGKGSVARVSPDGKKVERRWFAGTSEQPMHKPKGMWVRGNRFWVTDIDAVWIFDTKTKKSRRLAVPLVFANDPAVVGNALYVTDNRGDKLIRIEPADFLDAKVEPKISTVFEKQGIGPNGVAPGRGGKLLVVGFQPPEARGIYTVDKNGKVEAISEPLGRLDGVMQLADGSLLVTNWATSSLFQWSERTGALHLARDFKGPADFCVIPGKGSEMTVVVPDLPAGVVRFISVK